MRKDNYIIAMINKNILNFDFDLPFIGYQPFFTKTIEWSIYLTIIDFMFDENNSLKIDFLRSDLKFKLIETLKYRFYFIGIFSLLLSPFILVILGLYYLFKYGEEYKNQSNFIASRQWSLYAKWKFRQFNELIDNFQKRMNKSHKSAIDYVNQFPSYKMFNIFRLFEFITGAFICFIVALTIYDDEVLTKLNVFENRSALWALGLLGTMLTLFRCYKIEDNFIFEPIIIMKDVVKNTHYIPEIWKNKCKKNCKYV